MPILKRIVTGTSATGVANVRFEDMVRPVGHAKIAQLVDLNEKVLSLTDDLLADFMKLMMELPKISEQLISKKIMGQYGQVFKPEFSPETQATVSKRVPVNQEALSRILGA